MTSPDAAGTHPPLPGARAGRDPDRAIKRGPSRVPPEVVAATQRDRLYDALVHTVAQKGFANARVGDICQAAGVTRPAFYALFEGKEDAFLATYRHGIGVLWEVMEAAYAAAPDWRTGIRAGIGVLLSVLAGVPSFAVMAVVEIDAAGPAARREREELLERFHRFFAEAPHREQVPAELVSSIIGGIYSTIYRAVAGGRVAALPDLLATLTYFAQVPFIGREEAAGELTGRVEAVIVNAPCVPAVVERPAGVIE
ncbi:TetR/AcrR family transcriptional regulator [Catellatospora sp. KI3]|uniref:TetR/AcrR family transcriptional regulator n=1 Tax=Catellatospora sp. KI3 TaxID=3041620 RepID=UPI00248241CF|nr:TetR/AcrR family transcriptional regulator [Catellatospora sp. KI3]MDI1462882.1 TetR/AcrR family transcriptional regulator [Catellatospora sp. KI3]